MNFSLLDKQKGYKIIGNKIKFIFSKNLYQVQQFKNITINQVGVLGSFTAWNETWDLNKNCNNIWTLETELNKINIPGNCGHPEFRFIINNKRTLDASQDLPLDYKFYDDHGTGYKNIILFSDDNPHKIKNINHRINTYKTKYKSKFNLTNFRAVNLGNLGENNLYRSYHPFKKSRPEHPLEDKRIKVLQNLIKKHNINSIINLSDTQIDIPQEFKYYKNLFEKGNIIYTNRDYDYDIFYYITKDNNFKKLIRNIISFIIEKSPPYLVHCRIGTDRTGLIIAILAAFMGAEWKDIVNDYKKSNKLGIGEYRDEELLRYAFKRLLNDSLLKENLQEKVTTYLQKKVQLSKQNLTDLRVKLK